MSRSESQIDSVIMFVAGGVGGTTGAIVTCPLEVVKTRLQSSNSGFPTGPDPIKEARRIAKLKSTPTSFGTPTTATSAAATDKAVTLSLQEIACERLKGQTSIPIRHRIQSDPSMMFLRHMSSSSISNPRPDHHRMNVFNCLRFIYITEGVPGLFKGLGPNLMGVAPSRAIYFWAYNTAKIKINSALPRANRDTPFVHVVSAMSAGFSASTTTNPIWLIKTRLQLDRASGKKTLSIRKCIKQIYNERGILGFWRGVTASYWGISETVIHFVVYEKLKKLFEDYTNKRKGDKKTFIDFFGLSVCAACSKFCATCTAYPHEVARTRLREQGDRYKSFWQTIFAVYREDGRKGLYRGLGTQLVRQIPNTAIMMSTYELTVYCLTCWVKQPSLNHTNSLTSDLSDAAKDARSSVR